MMDDDDSKIDDTLVERAKRGNTRALLALVYVAGTRYTSFINARIPNDCRSVISAEDVIQNARFTAFREIAKLQSASAPGFMAWFKRIVENSLNTEVRALQAKKRGRNRTFNSTNQSSSESFESHEAKELSPSQKLELEEVLVAVQSNLNDLPTTQRNAVRIHHLESRSLSETAKQLGTTPGKIRGIIERARKQMKRAMGRTSKWFTSSTKE